MKYLVKIILCLILSFGVSASTNAIVIDSKSELNPEPKYALEVANYSFGIESYNLESSEFSSPCYTHLEDISTIEIFRFNSESGPKCSGGGGTCECSEGQECSADDGGCECTNDDDRSTLRRLIDRIL